MLTNNTYSEIFKLTPLPIAMLLVKDRSIIVSEVNMAYLKLLQFKETEVLGANFIPLLNNISEQSALIQDSILSAFKKKETDSVKATFAKGSYRCKIDHIPITNENGEIEVILHILNPIAEQSNTTHRLLSSIISNTEEAFIVLNQELIITSFNEQFSKLYLDYFGISAEIGNSILVYAQPNRIQYLEKLYANVLRGNIEHSVIDITYKEEDRKIALKYSPIKDNKQDIIGVFVTAKDVTSITNFEAELKSREQELMLIFQNLTEIVFLIHVEDNKKYKFKSVNEAFYLASGLSESQIIGKYVEEIIPEPSLTMVLAKYKEAIESKNAVSWEETSIYPTGKKTGVVSVNPIFDEKSNCIELIGSVYDITERVQANERLGKIMNSSLDVICTVNKEGKFVTVSAAAERIWGYEPAEVIGKSYIDFVHEEDRDLTNKIAELIIEGLETSNFENRYLKKDGTLVPIIWSARWDKEAELMFCTAKDGTDRLKSEKQLQESEQRFKSLVQEGSDMIGILDLEGNYLYVSPTSMAVLGMSPEDFIGQNAFNFIHPEDAETVFANFGKVGIEKRVVLKPFRFKHKDGTWRWIETVATDLLDEPAIRGIVTNSRDVTDKIAAEKAILLINERYKLVTKATSDAIWDWDLASDELYWGEGFQLLFGYKPADLATDISSWTDRIHPEDAKRVIKSVQEVIESNSQNWINEYRYLKADGQYTFVQDRGFVIRDEQNKAIRMVGALEDINQRKKEEQELKLLESVITHTNDSVLITEAEPIDGSGPKILYVNNAFTKLTGYTADEVIGKTPRIFQGPKTDRAVLDQLKEHLKKWEPCEATLLNYKKNGEEFWIHMSITPVADEKGWFTHWISIERDVTDQKNQEIQKILLTNISQLFNSSLTLTETLNKVLKTTSAIGNYCAAEIWLVDDDKQKLNLLAKYSAGDKMEQFYLETKDKHTFKFGEGLPGTVWKSKALHVWDIDSTDFSKFRTKAAHKANIKKGIGLPLFDNEQVNGVLILGTTEDKGVSDSAVLSANFGQHLGAEIKRKQLEQELDQLFNFAPDIIAISNLEGYFKKINPAACGLLEYTLDEFLSQPITTFIHPDDQKHFIDQLHAYRNKSETYYYENRYLTKSGRIKWLAWASNALVEEGLVFSVAKDITDQKNLAGLLLKSNSMGKVGSWEIDVIGGTVHWSEITHEIRETTPGFIPTLETGIHHFKEGKDKETITQKVNECKNNGTPWDEELQIITFKGNLKWIRTIGQAEMINGKCIRIYGSFQDIDERKKAELKIKQAALELKESEKRYSDLFHLSPLSMWVFDAETLRFLDVNQTAIKHYGYSYNEFLSMTVKDIRPVEEVPYLEKAIIESAAAGELFYEGVFIHQNKEGKRLNVEIKSNAILFKGKMAKVIVANDITERLAYFNALEQQNKKLQEISWIQSHIIRAPLAKLMGLVYLLKNKDAQNEINEQSIIDHIEKSTEELDLKIREIIEKSDHRDI